MAADEEDSAALEPVAFVLGNVPDPDDVFRASFCFAFSSFLADLAASLSSFFLRSSKVATAFATCD